MKKLVVLIMVLIMTMGIVGCSSAPAEEAENATRPETEGITQTSEVEPGSTPAPVVPQIWELQKTVDEFGDVTEDSSEIMQATFTGTFSNSATTDSEVKTNVYLLYNEDNSRCYVGFKLFEYGDTPVICSYGDNIILKTKVGDIVSEYDEILPNYIERGTLLLGCSTDWMNYDGNQFINSLYDGKDVKCVFYINNSQYNFIVESGNFRKLYDEPNVGKVSLPGTYVGGWEYNSGDATAFSRLVSNGENLVETKTLDIECEEITTYGNLVPLIIKDTENNITKDFSSSSFSLDIELKGTYLSSSFAQDYNIEIREDKILVITVKYYQGEAEMTLEELSEKLYDDTAVTTVVCEYKRVQN